MRACERVEKGKLTETGIFGGNVLGDTAGTGSIGGRSDRHCGLGSCNGGGERKGAGQARYGR